MTGKPSNHYEPVTGKAELIAYFEAGAKPAADWRIGVEHEKFLFDRRNFCRLPYEGDRGIRAILERLQAFDWEPVLEDGLPIGLNRGAGAISLEPGGQFELSGAPLASSHENCAEIGQHFSEMGAICQALDIGMLGLGFDPQWPQAAVPRMPKQRYRIMERYMAQTGSLGIDMMTRTSTVQANLDYASEADMVKKFRVSLALQPVATALFAASPFTQGRPNGYLSYRSHVWTDTDPDRCGTLPFVFEQGMGFERYVDYLLDVPMYFLYRDGQYHDIAGQSFRDFLRGALPQYPKLTPYMSDFVNHLSTVFPEVRLKRYLEMRGADAGPRQHLCALPALWTGLLYSTTALDAAWDLVRDWTPADHHALRTQVPRSGLDTPWRHGSVRDLALETLKIARAGLSQRNLRNAADEDESLFLDPLFTIAESGRTLADRLLASWHGEWAGDITRLYREYAY